MVKYEGCWPMGSVPTGRALLQLCESPFKYLKPYNLFWKALWIPVNTELLRYETSFVSTLCHSATPLHKQKQPIDHFAFLCLDVSTQKSHFSLELFHLRSSGGTDWKQKIKMCGGASAKKCVGGHAGFFLVRPPPEDFKWNSPYLLWWHVRKKNKINK